MARRRGYTPEQIITKLREAESYLSQGKTVKEASKLPEISEQPTIGGGGNMGGCTLFYKHKGAHSILLAASKSFLLVISRLGYL